MVDIGSLISTAVLVGGAMAVVFAAFRGKAKNDTIDTLERLVSAMTAEHEIAERSADRRISVLEARVDTLQSDFAAQIAVAIVAALPEAYTRLGYGESQR
jgi:hypothetical protein